MAIQDDITRAVALRKQVSLGTIAPNDATAVVIRRASSSIGLSKDAISSNEINTNQQGSGIRHGMRRVGGDISGELSLGTYAQLMASALRRDFAAVAAVTGLTNVTAAAAAPHFVRAAGSWLTDGFRVGMMFRVGGFTTTGVPNNGRTYTITALTATNITVAEPVAAKASGDTVAFTPPGKVTFIPSTGHTNDLYTVEDWAPLVPQSQRFVDQRVGGFEVGISPNSMASIKLMFMGRDRQQAATQYFTSATAAGVGNLQSSQSGFVYFGGVLMGTFTQLSLSVNGNLSGEDVVFANITPDVFRGTIKTTGSFSVLYADTVTDQVFDLEQERDLLFKFTNDTGLASEAMTFTLPLVKLTGGTKSPGKNALVEQYQFEAAPGIGANGHQATTIQIHDTLAP